MTNPITLSKFKAMTAQDLASALEAKDTISVEAGGQHLFDVVRPLNALDEHFLSVSRYVAQEVASEFRRKIETMRVEDMFDSRNVESVLADVAASMSKSASDDEETKSSKPPAPKKKGQQKDEPEKRTTKPAAKARPSRSKNKAAVAKRSVPEPKPSTDGVDAVTTNRVRTTSAPAPIDDLDLEPFPQDTVSVAQEVIVPLAIHETDIADPIDDVLDSDPYPESDAGGDYDDDLDDSPLNDLISMELTPEEIAAEDASEGIDDDDDDDDDFSDEPIVRKIARNRA